ncbi:hypothetical protein WMY93_024836 [Mugilogobius chulae]|uniref:Uncharacterized protein n=1 Tax=Mugilogobius chulae TaxID=88201 RepID=A0AAW0N7J1_9GOBI
MQTNCFSSFLSGWSQTISEVNLLDVEDLGWCAYSWSAVVRPQCVTEKHTSAAAASVCEGFDFCVALEPSAAAVIQHKSSSVSRPLRQPLPTIKLKDHLDKGRLAPLDVEEQQLYSEFLPMTAEAILRLVNDPVLPFFTLDVVLDIQNKLREKGSVPASLLSAASSLRDHAAFFQSEVMRPANDPKERDPAHVRMLNDVLRDVEKSFILPQAPPGVSRNLLYSLPGSPPQFSTLRFSEDSILFCNNTSHIRTQSSDQGVLRPLSHDQGALGPVSHDSSCSSWRERVLDLILGAVRSADRLICFGQELFENYPNCSTSRCPDLRLSPELCVEPLSVRVKQRERSWRQRVVYLQCYFLTIATILGTGILGLPGDDCSRWTVAFPRLVSGRILCPGLVDLPLRGPAAEMSGHTTGNFKDWSGRVHRDEPMGIEPQTLTDDEDEDDGENARADAGLLYPSSSSAPQPHPEILQPHLHLLGRLFLPRPMSHAFNCILLFHFVSIGISYVLAGSEAYASLLSVQHIYVIPVFTWILTLSILLAHKVIQPITSVLTLLKGVLLVVTVAVTFAVGSEVGLHSSSDFSQMGRPFLMGTVALDPVVSQSRPGRPQHVYSAQHPLSDPQTTALPQIWPTGAGQCWRSSHRLQSTAQSWVTPTPEPLLFTNVSLEQSEKAGEIATIPLTKIIQEHYSVFSWVAVLIQIFISISVTVSFLVMGSALKHTVDGLVTTAWGGSLDWLSKCWKQHVPDRQPLCSALSLVKGLLCLLAFIIIFIVSMCDPKGFVVILDKVVSFSLNTEVGLFIFFMLRESREDQYQSVNVPLPVGDCIFSLSWLLPCYFLFAVVYDVLQTVADLLPLLPHSHWALNHSIALSWNYNSTGLL